MNFTWRTIKIYFSLKAFFFIPVNELVNIVRYVLVFISFDYFFNEKFHGLLILDVVTPQKERPLLDR